MGAEQSGWKEFLDSGSRRWAAAEIFSRESERVEMYHSGSEESDLVSLSKHTSCYSNGARLHFFFLLNVTGAVALSLLSLFPLNKEDGLALQENGGYYCRI